ncbi:hypothetical protein HNY73_010811 [Argiope bruennichi]|uniref:Uncharacterized protein n=1 Tax=Argiope bruennichi TaxID=94029 RepID=A0A8T0F722_ARGBR|nr:hypothetical protein HNY73_010811 [Argiope bruennichi]
MVDEAIEKYGFPSSSAQQRQPVADESRRQGVNWIPMPSRVLQNLFRRIPAPASSEPSEEFPLAPESSDFRASSTVLRTSEMILIEDS